MTGLLTRTVGYDPTAPDHGTPRYQRVVYLTAPPAASVTRRAAATLPAPLQGKITIRDLPEGALR